MAVLEEQDMRDAEKVIPELAHELWEQAGRPESRSDEFWFAARFESECREETGETQPGAPVGRGRAEALVMNRPLIGGRDLARLRLLA
jgi:hypothetical protein